MIGYRRAILPLILLGLVGFTKISIGQEKPLNDQPVSNSYTQVVKREVLATGLPASTPGQVLELVRYVIPPQVNLPVHIHPGMQIEKVEYGMLTYAVVEGQAIITRANGQVEYLKAGETTVLKVGDSLVEPAGMVHYGKNETNSEVILLSASLFEQDKPKAILMPK